MKIDKTKIIAKVFRSNKDIYVQLIDNFGNVVAQASSKEIKEKMKPVETAAKVGQKLAEKAVLAKIASIIFDRNGYRYHGRVKALADGIRSGGIKF